MTSVTEMPPEVIALICSSVLIFFVFLSSAIVLISRRLRHRTQSTTQVQAQAQVPAPLASESKEQVDDVFSPTSSSSKSLASKTSAALSKDDKYTTLPLRRSRHARQSRIKEENPIFDLSMSLAALDAEIVNSETARRHSRLFSSARSVSLTSGTAISGSPNASTRSELQTYSLVTSSGTGGQSPIRPSPTIMSMEARPLETDAAALPDAGTLFVSGSIPSFSSISSALSLPCASVCQPATDDHPTNEAEANKRSYTAFECKTPRRQREVRAHVENQNLASGTPSSSSTSVSTVLTAHDTTFSSDASSVSEVGLALTSGKVPTGDKARGFKLGDVLTLPVSVFDLSFDLASGKDKDDAAPGLHPNLGPRVLSSLAKHAGDTEFDDGGLMIPALADAAF